MAQKKITDLTLRDDFDETCNIPVDDASQTWRVTGAKLKDFLAPLTTKGDLLSSDGTDNSRLAVGSNGTCLQADSGETTGLKWVNPRLASVGTKSGDYTILDNDGYEIILVTTGSSLVTITLPAASTNVGRRIAIKKVDTGSGKLVVQRAGSDTIEDGSRTSVQVAFAGDTLSLVGSTSSKWDFQGQHYQSFSETSPTISNAGTGPSGFVKGVRNGRIVSITASLTTGASGSPTTPSMSAPLPTDFRPNITIDSVNEIVSATDSWYRFTVNTSGGLDFTRHNLAGAQDVNTASWANGVTEKFSATYVVY